MQKRKLIFALALVLGAGLAGKAQEARVSIDQDSLIPTLMELKTELRKASKIGDRYRIQIFSGDNKAASEVLKEFRNEFKQWPSTVIYVTPNYKVWVGNFRNSLAADRALLEIRNSFPAAFRFKPN